MKLKNGVTLEGVCEKLKKELASHLEVKINNNPLYKNIRWVEVNKDAFVGVKIFLKDDQLLLDGQIPNFFAKAFFGGFISGVFHHGARRDFKQKIADFLISEFYAQ
jgi:hypothetical protein